MKEVKCTICGGRHYKTFCPKAPKKPIKRTGIKSTKAKKVNVAKYKTKAKTRSWYVHHLDSAFSQYVRLDESDKNGIGTCITCGVKKHWSELQNCHFYSRSKLPTRWDVDNCHSGCYRCNVLLKGNYIEYTKYMIDSYGRPFVDELKVKADSCRKISTLQLKEMIDYYKKEVKALENSKK